MRGWAHDLRFALRALRREPGFAFVAVALLALGIGSTTGVFSAVNTLLLRPLPGLERPQELVALGIRTGRSGFSTFPNPLYETIRDDVEAFGGRVAASSGITIDLRIGSETHKARAEIVSGNYFSVLEAAVTIGRGFTPDETAAPDGPLVAVLSHRTWLRSLGGDPGVLGRPISVNGSPFTVVGVAGPDFAGTSFTDGGPELWVPLSTQRASWPVDWSPLTSMSDYWLRLYARLLPDASIERARAELEVLAAALREAYPEEAADTGFEVTGRLAVPNPAVRARLGRTLGMLFVVVGLLLTIVCANLANLSLGRAVARRREVGIRVALGASPGRVLRQLLFESLALSLAGAGLGLVLAGRVSDVVLGLARVAVPPPDPLDGLVAAFALMLAVVTGALFGVAPAVARVGGGALALLDRRGGGGPGRARVRRGLAVGQVALSATLLVVATLFARSLRNMQRIELGFEPDGVLLAAVDLGARGLGRDEGLTLYGSLLERIRALPGVSSASLVLHAPLTGALRSGGFLVENREDREGVGRLQSTYNQVFPGYFSTMGIPLLRGRDFTPEDDAGAPLVAVVSASFAAWVWPDADQIGKRFSRGDPSDPGIEVVGVVADSRFEALDREPSPLFFLALQQSYEPRVRLVVRAAGEPLGFLPAIRDELRRLDPEVPLYATTTMRSQVDAHTAQFRLTAWLTGAFSTLAVTLAGLGLYGLLSYAVSQRAREIGLRMALGARSSDVTGMVALEGVVLTLAGLALGLAGAVGAARLARSLLFDVEPLDVPSFLVAAVLLTMIAAVASWVPARRASRVDPMEALRVE
ncbi:MAG TPA: ABC transporter permease [Longimicrobiales bacterium]|nr:ABC transporter permease [Longimicrobiales bacterium]